MGPVIENDPAFFDQSHFRHILRVQRMRTERSKKPFLLLLIDISRLIETMQNIEIVDKVKTSLDLSLREIDIRGWYNHNNRTIGVLLTEIESINEASIDTIIHKIYDRFCEKLDPNWIKKIYISFHIFPETKQGLSAGEPFNINFYPDLVKKGLNKKLPLFIKNIFFDIVGSAIAFCFFHLFFLIIAVVIKATSAGPVFFRQERVGLNGKHFFFLNSEQ